MMKKIVYIILCMIVMVISSCSSQKHVTTTTATENTSAIQKLDSLFQQASIDENIDIAWNFDEDPGIKSESNKTQNETPIKPSAKSPPKKGSVHITISKRAEVIKSRAKVDKKCKQKQKIKDKKIEKKKKKVKNVKKNIFLNALFIIIFALIVKLAFQHKNKLKKVWNLLKKMLNLQRD